MNNLLIVGSVAYDSIKTPFGKVKRALGGSATYFSLAARFFIKPMLVAVVGNDFAAADKKILGGAADISGLQTESGKTFAWGGEYSFDLNSRETLFTRLNVFENFKPRLLPRHTKAGYIFSGNIHPSLQLEVLSQINKPKFVGLDTMNFWISSAPKQLAKVLKLVNVFIINDSEARQLSGEHNLIKAAKKIMRTVGAGLARPLSNDDGRLKPAPTLIIKRGEYGLMMFQKSQIFHLPGYPLEKVIDPTGAGDSFAGGFMGYLAKTNNTSWKNLKKACAYGSALASFCCERLGTRRLQKIRVIDIKQRLKDFKSQTDF